MPSNPRIDRFMRELLGPPSESTHLPRNTYTILGAIALLVVSACAVVGTL